MVIIGGIVMLYVARHGQTDWNISGKIQGLADISLNEEGKRQAYQLKEKTASLGLDYVITSPLLRAKQTAEIISDFEIPIVIDKRLTERDFGEFEGLTKQDFDTSSFWNHRLNQKYEKAENVRDFLTRVYHFLDEYKTIYETNNVLVVTHAGVVPAIGCYFNGIPTDNNLFTYHCPNGEILKFK